MIIAIVILVLCKLSYNYSVNLNEKIMNYSFYKSLEGQNIEVDLYDGHSINYVIQSYDVVSDVKERP